MRCTTLLLGAILIGACASKSPTGDSEVFTHVGRITDRQEATGAEVRDSGLSTSVRVSASSGGGLSIGIGFLVSKLLSGGDEAKPMRYVVEMVDGESMTIFHDSRDFEVGDCVTIRVYPEKRDKPPSMKRSEGSC